MVPGTQDRIKDDGHGGLDALAIVALLWAAQTLIQLTVFHDWRGVTGLVGWIAFGLAIGVLLNPRSLRLFMALIIFATSRYIIDWPFVSNHLLLDTFISVAIVGSAARVVGSKIVRSAPLGQGERDAIVQTLSPLVTAMFVLMYYWIVISKMNHDFINKEMSCMHSMYIYVINRNDIIEFAGSLFSVDILFWVFMIIEWMLPLMLTFRRTRSWAIYVGVPFHLLLGVMGHYWYSSLVLTLYAIVALPSVMEALPLAVEKLGAVGLKRVRTAFRAVVTAGAVLFAASAIIAPVQGFMSLTMEVLLWSVPAGLVGLALVWAVAQSHYRHGIWTEINTWPLVSRRPGLLWGVVGLMSLNSLSPYIGYKTTGAISMYSNLRTEGDFNNHMFMPTIDLFEYQDDLVEVIDSNDPIIRGLAHHPVLYGDYDIGMPAMRAYLELRRAVSRSGNDSLWVRYKRGGDEYVFDRKLPENQHDLDRHLPFWLQKTASFRPVFKDRSYCLH